MIKPFLQANKHTPTHIHTHTHTQNFEVAQNARFVFAASDVVHKGQTRGHTKGPTRRPIKRPTKRPKKAHNMFAKRHARWPTRGLSKNNSAI